VRSALWGLAAIVVAFVIGYGVQELRRDAKLEQATRTIDSLRTVTAKVDTIYERDSVVVWRLKRQTDTLTQTEDRGKHDRIEVVRYVLHADSTIRACRALVETCEERVAVRDATIAAQTRRWENRPKPKPAVWVWAERGVVFWLGTQVR